MSSISLLKILDALAERNLLLQSFQWLYWEVMVLPLVSVHNHFLVPLLVTYLDSSEAHYPFCSPSLILGNRFNSGFGHVDPETHMFRKDGWVPNASDYVLSNKYYKSLVDPFWHMQFIDNQNTKVITDEGEVTTMAAFNVPHRFQWYLDENQKNVFMTNSDIALFVDCEEHLISDIDGIPGLCMCLFSDDGEIDEELSLRIPAGVEAQGNCPSATQTVPYVQKYLNSNVAFHYDFAEAIDVMVTNGYVEHE